MPNYTYKCKDCGEVYDFTCNMSQLDSNKPKECKCGCTGFNQDFGNIGISYKCDGFYNTDSKGE